MAKSIQQLAEALRAALGDRIESVSTDRGEVTVEVAPDNLVEVATRLRDDEDFRFQQLIDVCGVDYSQYGRDEWLDEEATHSGFSRGVTDDGSTGRLRFGDELASAVAPGRRSAGPGRPPAPGE